MLIFNLLISTILFGAQAPNDSIPAFHNQLWNDIHMYLQPPAELDSQESCYHFTELLKVKIDKSSKVQSIDLSDSAPAWLRKDIDKLKAQKRIDFKKLDSLAKKMKLRNCDLVFPLIIETDDFPCGHVKKQRNLKENYFQFDGKQIKGNIIFGEQIVILFSTRFRYKSN